MAAAFQSAPAAAHHLQGAFTVISRCWPTCTLNTHVQIHVPSEAAIVFSAAAATTSEQHQSQSQLIRSSKAKQQHSRLAAAAARAAALSQQQTVAAAAVTAALWLRSHSRQRRSSRTREPSRSEAAISPAALQVLCETWAASTGSAGSVAEAPHDAHGWFEEAKDIRWDPGGISPRFPQSRASRH